MGVEDDTVSQPSVLHLECRDEGLLRDVDLAEPAREPRLVICRAGKRMLRSMPTIAYFLGIAVRMFFNDHDPPHIHVRYQGYRARIRIADGEIIDGSLPPTATRLVKQWSVLRHDALMRNWQAARANRAMERIPGLDDD
jgi:hypothetical protein